MKLLSNLIKKIKNFNNDEEIIKYRIQEALALNEINNIELIENLLNYLYPNEIRRNKK